MSTNNGDFINKDISLKGGVSIAVHYDKAINEQELASYLSSKGFSVNVRTLYSGSDPLAILIESDVEINDAATKETLLSAIQEKTGIEKKTYSVETMSAAIGDSFFKDAMRALLISFILMSLVVLFTFRTFIPSAAVILAALSDIIITIAVLNLLHVKISTAGIAALLMLIGYSVDTDILLTSRVLKRKEGTVLDRVLYSIKTGMMMNATAFVVIILGMLLTSSDIIKQIMLILFIGMLADQINTWIQNAGILRWYMEHKAKKQGSEQ
jgi:preprotein translocase subunit SecF